MPAKTTIFDHRSNVLHDFGTAPRNFISYNPQGRLLLIAGFGNLAGTMDIWDRRSLKKVSTIEASNTVHCEWSPDGRFIMCATLSPRLRVDNGIKIYHYAGGLMHEDLIPELYAASWKPAPPELYPFRQSLSPAPAPSTSVQSKGPATPLKPAGAYRPPHARGTLTPTQYKREDEGGAPYVAPTNGSVPGAAPGAQSNGRSSEPYRAGGGARRGVPGMTVPGMAPKANGNTPTEGSRRNKKGKGGNSGPGTPAGGSKSASPMPSTPGTPRPSTPPLPDQPGNNAMATPDVSRLALDGGLGPANVPLGQLSPEEKKRRALTKKLTAIAFLKERRDKGEKLEVTQLHKISTEAETRKELDTLG